LVKPCLNVSNFSESLISKLIIMKIIHYINCIAVISTILLYTVYGQKELTAQFFLGCYQILIAIIITLQFKRFPKYKTDKIFYYWLAVIIWFIIDLSLNDLIEEYFILISIPMLIACYFTYITHLIRKTKT